MRNTTDCTASAASTTTRSIDTNLGTSAGTMSGATSDIWSTFRELPSWSPGNRYPSGSSPLTTSATELLRPLQSAELRPTSCSTPTSPTHQIIIGPNRTPTGNSPKDPAESPETSQVKMKYFYFCLSLFPRPLLTMLSSKTLDKWLGLFLTSTVSSP